MGLTFDQLKKRVGKNLKYYDDNDGWLTGRDVTETDIGDYINEIYTEVLFPEFAVQYQEDFRQIARTNSWIATGTVDASSTSTTLVATTAIFTNSMIGLKVYNSTDDETAEITGYTSTTTVTLDTTIGDTWDGDTVWVLGQEFAFGGDSTDIYAVESVGVKFASTATYYLKATRGDKHNLLTVGNEEGNTAFPRWYLTTATIGGVLTTAIGIYPKFSNKVTNAIEINYIAKPAVLSGSSDKPRLPVDSALLFGATARAFEKKQDFQSAGYWIQRFERQRQVDLSNYRPLSMDDTAAVYPSRRVGLLHNRNI